jgi:hypothetical protein
MVADPLAQRFSAGDANADDDEIRVRDLSVFLPFLCCLAVLCFSFYSFLHVHDFSLSQ